jgi:hypothetical protein
LPYIPTAKKHPSSPSKLGEIVTLEMGPVEIAPVETMTLEMAHKVFLTSFPTRFVSHFLTDHVLF